MLKLLARNNRHVPDTINNIIFLKSFTGLISINKNDFHNYFANNYCQLVFSLLPVPCSVPDSIGARQAGALRFVTEHGTGSFACGDS